MCHNVMYAAERMACDWTELSRHACWSLCVSQEMLVLILKRIITCEIHNTWRFSDVRLFDIPRVHGVSYVHATICKATTLSIGYVQRFIGFKVVTTEYSAHFKLSSHRVGAMECHSDDIVLDRCILLEEIPVSWNYTPDIHHTLVLHPRNMSMFS